MAGHQHPWIWTFWLAMLLGIVSCEQHAQMPMTTTQKQPNIIFILSDDQDLHMDSLTYMPFLKKHLLDQGTFYSQHYCTVALCCPSRVSLWTGKAAHNTNVTDVTPPYGGYPKFVTQGLNKAYLPIWLQEAGYATYYVGKLMNSHSIDNYDSPYPRGWTDSDFLLDPHTYEYLNATFQRGRERPVSHEGEYSTDLIANKALGFLDDAVDGGQPFFLTVAPIAPHANFAMRKNSSSGEHIITRSPPVPAERHKHLFPDAVIPRTPNFNPVKAHGVSWISQLPRQNQSNVDSNDEFYRNRLRALQAVDEMIDAVFTRLEKHGLLEDTYIFYSSDNGYHIGQHRLQPGKQCSFQEDVNVPLIVRGPGIKAAHHADVVTSHTDLAPTFMSLAQQHLRADFDGIPIPLHAATTRANNSHRGEHVNVENWGTYMNENDYGPAVFYANHTYKSLRVIGEEYDFSYTVWCTGEHELYSLFTDPFQTRNLLEAPLTPLNQTILVSSQRLPLGKIQARLDALLMVLKSCKQRSCTHPWETLHPHGDVHNLRDALGAEYDAYYENQVDKVEFTKCERGYILASEGPQKITPYLFDEL